MATANKNARVNGTLAAARSYLAAGLSIIPIGRDGEKKPDCHLLPRVEGKPSWATYQKELPTADEIDVWFDRPDPPGIAILGGKASGGLEQLDFDGEAATIFPAWCDLVEAEIPGLIARLPIARTPGGGFHVRYRCTGVELLGNKKLAENPAAEKRTLIETRGEGGYAIAPGSPAACHKTNRTYEHHSGPPIAAMSTITPAEREVLLRCARSFNRKSEPACACDSQPAAGQNRPGDIFTRTATWEEILEPHGWRKVAESAEKTYWCRPGKGGRSWSATTRYCRGPDGQDMLYVFSSSAAPFENEKSYSRFAAFALLNHAGDFAAAAKALAKKTHGPSKNGSHQNGSTNGTPENLGLATTCLIDIKPEPVRWLVPGYFPLGKLVLIAGDGGHGKSVITLSMAACLSRGWPCLGLDCPQRETAETLLVSCEDDYADTVVPRLLAASADLSKIHRVDGVRTKDGKPAQFSLAHYQELERELQLRPDVRLIVIDPTGAYIGRAGVDDHKDSELRSLLGPLSDMAGRRRISILLVKHLVKGATAKAVHKVSGSAGYVNAVRAAFVVAPDAQDENKKLFLPLKFNLGPKPRGLSYRLQELLADEAAAILDQFDHLEDEDRLRLGEQLFGPVWLGSVDTDADTALGDTGRKGKDQTQVDQATEWLLDVLSEYAFPDPEIIQAANAKGFTFDTLKKAKKKLREDGKLRASNRGAFMGTWWNGLGDPAAWVKRPEGAKPTIHQNHQNGKTSEENGHSTPLFLHSGDSGDASDTIRF